MNNVYTVQDINLYIKNMFSNDYMLKSVYVRGEASNVKYHSSGHIYYTLKDKTGSISCVMFAGSRKGLNFKLQDGQQIICLGRVGVYERDGKYLLYSNEIVLDGLGQLYEQYELLKRELEEMGMFSAEYKKRIPKYAKTVGIVTASTGAAIQDIINISTRRNPYVQLILYPAKVQGEGASDTIVNGIKALESKKVDVIIVGRGGGSIEDLWAFNEEKVARAIFDCSVPVVSAVGHETDVTISDYVADLRAPTPSAAAELTVFDLSEFEQKINKLKDTMQRAMTSVTTRDKGRVVSYNLRLKKVSPENKITEKRMYAAALSDKMELSIKRILETKVHAMQMYASRLDSMSPLKRLKNGYALIDTNTGVISSVEDVEVGQSIELHLIDGDLGCTIKAKKQIDRRACYDK